MKVIIVGGVAGGGQHPASAMSHKFCARFRQFNMLKEIEHIPKKIEYRNPKSETISKSECYKFKTYCPPCDSGCPFR